MKVIVIECRGVKRIGHSIIGEMMTYDEVMQDLYQQVMDNPWIFMEWVVKPHVSADNADGGWYGFASYKAIKNLHTRDDYRND